MGSPTVGLDGRSVALPKRLFGGPTRILIPNTNTSRFAVYIQQSVDTILMTMFELPFYLNGPRGLLSYL
jgi:hypothetical protein